jgi:hypothetical protein
MKNNSLAHLEIGNDGFFLERLRLSNINEPVKELFGELPYIWNDYIDTENNERLVKFTNQLLAMKQENGNSIDFLPETLKENASDCFVLLQQYQYAIEFFPSLAIGSCASWGTDKLLSLKYVARDRISGREFLTLLGPKVTKFGKEHLSDVLSNLTILIGSLWNKTKVDYISEWVKHSNHFRYQVGNGSPYGYFLTKKIAIEVYRFSYDPIVVEFATHVTRDAENMVREQLGIPKVGEGWVAETLLYYEIKKAFPDLEVKQHGTPDWLGRQHLDIFIPRKHVALEYQGIQHDQPVEYFGGQNSFEKNRKRDDRKYRLCKRHSVKLIYVRPFYDLKSIIEEIESQITSPGVGVPGC